MSGTNSVLNSDSVVFDWLFEGQLAVYVFLCGLALLLLYFWWRTRKRRWLFAVGGVVALIGLYFLLDRLVETDREQIQRKLEAMAAAVRTRDVDGIFQHVSDDFRSPQGKTKKDFRAFAQAHINEVSEVVVWEFKFREKPSKANPMAHVRFTAKFKGLPGHASDGGFPCEATFDYDPQHGWRLKAFRVFNPVQTAQEEYLPF
jgi:hypothetical protein